MGVATILDIYSFKFLIDLSEICYTPSKTYFSYSTQIKLSKITNVQFCHDAPQLNIDNTIIKNSTAELL